jgi:hypothetical protein
LFKKASLPAQYLQGACPTKENRRSAGADGRWGAWA